VALVIERVGLWPFRLPLRAPLATSRGRLATRDGVLVELGAAGGLRGFGEASPLPGWPGEPLAVAERALAEVAPALLRCELDAKETPLPDAAEALLARPALAAAPLARAALETALLDLVARARGVRLAELLAGPVRERVAVNALVVGDGAGEVASAAEAARARGYATWKLKVGHGPLETDALRVAALRRTVGPAGRIRLDAGGSWSVAEAARALELLARFDLEYVEEPLADPAQMAALRARAPVRLALEAGLLDPAALERARGAAAADVLVLKPALVGGLRRAQALARRARAAGLVVVVTSFLDSALGIAAALHLAAALPEPMPACGLATG
jgi:o-succinylbenzoate synthase